MKYFEDVESVLNSELYKPLQSKKETDRVLKSTKIEQMIYEDLYTDNLTLKECEDSGKKQLDSFGSLINDVFQSIYGITPKFNDDAELSFNARTINTEILKKLMKDDKYSAIKSVCEGKELPSISATEEFSDSICGNLNKFMENISGGKGRTDVLDRLENDRQELIKSLSELIHRRNEKSQPNSETIDKKIIQTANRIISKQEQKDGYEHIIKENIRRCGKNLCNAVENAANKALDKAKETESIMLAWGNGEPEMRKNELNAEILQHCAKSEKLKNIAKSLGRYRELITVKRVSGYKYGSGEKYDIEYGNSISKTLTSDLVLLSEKETMPLFIRKYQKNQLRKYRKREPEHKDRGDVIVCVDESGSTTGADNEYAMAITMLLGELCRINKTNFAVIHFSSSTVKTDCFYSKDELDSKKLISCAETFLGGGTNFENPLNEAMRLAQTEEFKKADIVFITDGKCDISDAFCKTFTEFKAKSGIKLIGILLDAKSAFEFSLQRFADKIFRTSELDKDAIAEKIIDERI